jgi:copper homeostasis protein
LNKILEIACFNKTSALIAQKAGANRIELSVEYNVGGVSPPEDLIRQVLQEIKLPVHVLIRPRPGNFVYSKEELVQMEKQIEFCRSTHVSGLVFGVLDNEGNINANVCKQLIQLSGPMTACFHRAIDECMNQEKALEQLIELGFDSVLSSGGEKDALLGLKNLKHWQKTFGENISIIAGGGIRSSNLNLIMESGCRVYHSSGITDTIDTTSEQEIKQMKSILNS